MKTGLFSVSYAGLWGQEYLEIETFIDKATRLGFDGVLLMAKKPHLSPAETSPSRIEALRKHIDSSGIELIGLAAYNDFLQPAAAEIPLVEIQQLYIRECCRICAALGGKIVRIFTGYEQNADPLFTQWDRIVRALYSCGEAAVDSGVTLAVQNHHDLAVDTAAMERLIADVDHPAVRCGFDAWSPFLRGESLFDSAKRMGSQTILSIAANYRRYSRYTYHPDLVNYSRAEPDLVFAESMQTGEIPYPEFIRGLKEGGYDGWFVYEMCSPIAGGGDVVNLDRKAAEFLQFCDKHNIGNNR